MGNFLKDRIESYQVKHKGTIQKLLTPKCLAILLSAGYGISLLPLLWIAKYNYPSADDYTNGSRCFHVWEAGHSLLGVLGEALSRTVEEWMTWRGCFTSSFLSALPPNIWGENLYFLTAWIVLITLTIATVFFFHELLVRGFHADKYTSHSVAMLVLFLTVQCMGESGRAEGFYWYSGAFNYVFMHSLSLLFYGFLIAAAKSSGRKRTRAVITAAVLGFLVAGGNQMTMLNAAIILFVVMIILSVRKAWKRNRRLIIPIVSFYLGFVLSIAAPGNFVRGGSLQGMNPIKAIFVSFYYCLDLMLSQWTTWTVIVLVACMVPLFWHMADGVSFRFRYPLIVVFFGYCVVSAMATPPLFVMGNIEAGRLKALMFLMYILVLTLCAGYVTGWVRQKQEESKVSNLEKSVMDGRYGVSTCLSLIGCILFFLMASLITIIPEPHYYTFSSALTDLMDGTAERYGAEQLERTRRYNDKSEKELMVEPLSAHPAVLFFSDIEEDAGDWKNQGICRYYGLDSVSVKKEDK